MKIDVNKSLVALNTFGFDQRAEYYAEASDEASLLALLEQANTEHWPLFILGGGSNIVLTTDIPGLILRFTGDAVRYDENGPSGSTRVTAQAGKDWHELVMETLARGLDGLENLALIPGSVGAAPVQNIGAYGVELVDRLVSVRAWHLPSANWQELDAAACDFSYRNSRFKRERGDWIITSVTFSLGPGHSPRTDYASLASELAKRGLTHPTALDVAQAVIAVRQRRLPDPAEIGNAGSFFHNPIVTREKADELLTHHPNLAHYPQPDGSVKLAAGWLIDQLGYRGMRENGVGIHEHQALVFVHEGGSSGSALMSLVDKVRQAVDTHYGVQLIPEPLIVDTRDSSIP